MSLANNTPTVQAIVAGILDLRSGEISDTITNPSGKTPLYHQVLALNDVHGKNAFMVFEFNTFGDLGNVDYIKRIMQSDDPSLLKPVYLLRTRYLAQQTEKSIERVKHELTLVNETLEECLALYGESQRAKRDIISDALSDEINQLQCSIKSLEWTFSQQKLKIKEQFSSVYNESGPFLKSVLVMSISRYELELLAINASTAELYYELLDTLEETPDADLWSIVNGELEQ